MLEFDSAKTPLYLLFAIGAFSFSLGVVFTCAGKTLLRGGRWIYRTEKPRLFWFNIAVSYLIGILLMGIALTVLFG
jgi:hypothetical protein